MQRLDFPIMHKFLAEGALLRRGFGFPVEVCDFVGRPQLGGGVAVATEAEGHTQGFGLVDFVHFIDLAVTFDATDTAVDVNSVVEIDVFRHFVDLHPRNRLAGLGAFADECEARVGG